MNIYDSIDTEDYGELSRIEKIYEDARDNEDSNCILIDEDI